MPRQGDGSAALRILVVENYLDARYSGSTSKKAPIGSAFGPAFRSGSGILCYAWVLDSCFLLWTPSLHPPVPYVP
jgi:hypothetical protein